MNFLLNLFKTLLNFIPVPIILWKLKYLKDNIKSKNELIELKNIKLREQNDIIEKLNLEKTKRKSLNDLLTSKNGYINHGVHHDKEDNDYIILENRDIKYIFVYQFDCYGHLLKKMMLIYSYTFEFGNQEKVLKINDIQSNTSNSNKGFGNKLLDLIETIAKQNKCYKIIGELSWVDARTHQDRLHSFYTKKGFSIKYRENHESKCIYADIYKNISHNII